METSRLGLILALLLLNTLGHAAEPATPDPEKLRSFNAAYAVFEEGLKSENIEQTLQKCTEAFDLAKALFGDSHKTTADLAYYCGFLFSKVGRILSAKEVLTEAVSIHERAYGADAFELVRVLVVLGDVLFGDVETQVDPLNRALKIHQQRRPDDRIGYADLATRAASHFIKKRPDKVEALRLLRESLSIYENEYGMNAPQLVPVLLSIGDASADPFNASRQQVHYRRAMKILKEHNPDDPVRLADMTLDVGKHVLQYSFDKSGAESYLNDAYSNYRKVLGDADPKTAQAMLALGEYHHFASGRHDKARTFLIGAAAAFSGNPNYRMAEARAHTLLAQSYERRGESDLATEHLLAAGRIAPWTPDQEVVPVFRANPDYPQAALAAGKEGWVTIDFTIDQSGSVQDAVVEQSEGHPALKQAALDAIKKWRYVPRYVDGNPVATPHLKTMMQFDLE